MQVLDDEKRRGIQDAAAALFASRPFHKVRLEEVAARAGVGKGTVYTYFASKDELYLSLLEEGFAAMVEQLDERLKDTDLPAIDAMSIIVAGLVDYALGHPHLFEMMRVAASPVGRPRWVAKRRALLRMIEATIRRGIDDGALHDPHPELTALFIPGLVRSVMLFSTAVPPREVLVGQIMRLLCDGIRVGGDA